MEQMLLRCVAMQMCRLVGFVGTCVLAAVAVGCEQAPTAPAEPPVSAVAQEIRAAVGARGQVFVGVDLLVTDEESKGIPCGVGQAEITVETSRSGAEGPWTLTDRRKISTSCTDGRGELALVLDNSRSLGEEQPLLIEGANRVVDRVVESKGRMSVVRVSTQAETVVPLTDSREELSRGLASMRVRNGWTALWDGVRLANETLAADATPGEAERHGTLSSFCATSKKRAVVVFTDGRENNSSGQKLRNEEYPGDAFDTQLQDLTGLEVAGVTTPVYTVGLGSDVDREALTSLSRSTGGRFVGVSDPERIGDVLPMIAEYFGNTRRVCAELPEQVCGPLDVRVTYRYTKGKNQVTGTKIEHLDVPCAARPKGKIATLLLALERAEVDAATRQRLVANTVRYVSPVGAPRVAVVRDDFHHGEHPTDTANVRSLLVAAGFAAELVDEPANGLSPSVLEGYDVVWFSNPGYPMDDAGSFQVLQDFSADGGGVVLQGDDMGYAHGLAFSLSPLTQLRFVDNGVSYCGINIDNGLSGRYRVTLEGGAHPLLSGLERLSFTYGDDIDTTVFDGAAGEVLAWATADKAKGKCTPKPVITVLDPAP
jgi:Mg-chelatase subunit ChlD